MDDLSGRVPLGMATRPAERRTRRHRPRNGRFWRIRAARRRSRPSRGFPSPLRGGRVGATRARTGGGQACDRTDCGSAWPAGSRSRSASSPRWTPAPRRLAPRPGRAAVGPRGLRAGPAATTRARATPTSDCTRTRRSNGSGRLQGQLPKKPVLGLRVGRHPLEQLGRLRRARSPGWPARAVTARVYERAWEEPTVRVWAFDAAGALTRTAHSFSLAGALLIRSAAATAPAGPVAAARLRPARRSCGRAAAAGRAPPGSTSLWRHSAAR